MLIEWNDILKSILLLWACFLGFLWCRWRCAARFVQIWCRRQWPSWQWEGLHNRTVNCGKCLLSCPSNNFSSKPYPLTNLYAHLSGRALLNVMLDILRIRKYKRNMRNCYGESVQWYIRNAFNHNFRWTYWLAWLRSVWRTR